MKFFKFFILGVLFFGSLFLFKNVFAAVTSPRLLGPTATSIGSTTATLGATIALQGTSAISARGTCWGTSPSPTSNCLNLGGTAIGTFTQGRGGFSPNTLYYYRGYATNLSGTGYSVDGTFTTLAPPLKIVNASPTTYNINPNDTVHMTYTVDFDPFVADEVTECQLLNYAYSPLTNYARSTSLGYAIDYSLLSSPGSYGFYIRCMNVSNSNTAISDPITVNVAPPAPVVTVTANGQNPLTITAGTKVIIRWNATNNPTSCKRMDLGTNVLVNGTDGFEITPTSTTTITIQCTN